MTVGAVWTAGSREQMGGVNILERRPLGGSGGFVKKLHMRQQKDLWAVSGMWWARRGVRI